MENHNLQRQKNGQKRTEVRCRFQYRRRKAKEITGQKRHYHRKMPYANKKCLEMGSY